MKLVFNLDDVICTPAKGIKFGIPDYIKNCLPIEDTIHFMQWVNKKKHHITIWCERPSNYINVDETPSHAKFYKALGDLGIVAEMYEEWKQEWRKNDR